MLEDFSQNDMCYIALWDTDNSTSSKRVVQMIRVSNLRLIPKRIVVGSSHDLQVFGTDAEMLQKVFGQTPEL